MTRGRDLEGVGMTQALRFLAICLLFGGSSDVLAQPVSLLKPELFSGSEAPLTPARVDDPTPEEVVTVLASPSLFIGVDGNSFFRPYPVRTRQTDGAVVFDAPRGAVARLRDLIGRAEAGPLGFDAVQYGARIKPERPPTQMTIGEIFAWIDRTPGQPHAIGRYQFIPMTLRRLVNILDLDPNTRFSPAVQDRMADVLLSEAGLNAFRSGALSRAGFMNNLAKIWAGFPNSSGRSHYHGYAGNAATMSWARFDAEMAAIFAG